MSAAGQPGRANQASPIRSYIPRARQVKVGRKRPFVYEVMLATSAKQWSIEKRYSEFFSLHRQLKDSLPDYPWFPPKKMVNNKDPKFIEIRRQNLEKYLERLLRLPNIGRHPLVAEFLQIPAGALSTQRRAGKFEPSVPSNMVWVDQVPGQPPADVGNRPIHDLQTSRDDIVSDAVTSSLDSNSVLRQNSFARLYFGSQTSLGFGKSELSLASIPRSPKVQPSETCPVMFKATADYKSGNTGDLEFKAGALISVVGVDESTGWWIGKKENQGTGLVPMNFVAVVEAGSDADSQGRTPDGSAKGMGLHLGGTSPEEERPLPAFALDANPGPSLSPLPEEDPGSIRTPTEPEPPTPLSAHDLAGLDAATPTPDSPGDSFTAVLGPGATQQPVEPAVEAFCPEPPVRMARAPPVLSATNPFAPIPAGAPGGEDGAATRPPDSSC